MIRPCLVAAACLTLAAAAPAPTGSRLEAMEQEASRRVNDIRREHGLPPFRIDPALTRAAREHSCRMARGKFLAHEAPDGRTVADRVRATGRRFRVLGENLAMNTDMDDPAATAVRGWLASPSHRDNLLHPEYTHTGLGVCAGRPGYYFTQIFLRP